MSQACKNCRKAGTKLFVKGERCMSPKCALTRRTTVKTGRSSRIKKSEYGLQLAEKQKAKAEYGIRERQFRLYFQKAARAKEATGEALLQNLEERLDSVVYRAGWAQSRAQARQIVNHGHVKVNGQVVDIPSYQVKIKDIIETNNKELVMRTSVEKAEVASWIKVNQKELKAEIMAVPTREEIETPVDEQLIVEFYSR